MATLLRRFRQCTLWCATVLLFGCPDDLTVGLGEGSTLQDLTFSISMGYPTALSLFIVRSCKGINSDGRDVYWAFESGDDPQELTHLSYGDVPVGYREVSAERDLQLDECYVVSFGVGEALYFVADVGGEITVVTKKEARDSGREVDPGE